MRPCFQEVERAIAHDGTNPNFKWKFNDKFLNEKQVAHVTKIAKYGIGNAYKAEAWVEMSKYHTYTPGEKPSVRIADEEQHIDDVSEHEWRVQDMSPESLRKYFDKTMGTKTFTKEDKDHFVNRHKCDHPEEYHIPQFMLNQPMGPEGSKKFKHAWKNPSDLAKTYAHRKNPWAQIINDLMIYNRDHRPERHGRKRKHQTK